MRQRVLMSLGLLCLFTPAVYAGSPHFTSCASSTVGTQICAEGKEAGLGDEAQITVNVAVTAHCENPGGNAPKAANKDTFETNAQVPVQNGKALFDLCVTPTFQPTCSPPMTVVVDTVVVTDETNGQVCILQ